MKVEFDGVTVRLGGTDVVRAVSASVEPGTVLGLVGPNGSGKSTLLRTLYRALVPAAGTVRLAGTDVRTLTRRHVARSVAVMLQDPSTDFDLTVTECVLLGRTPHHATFGRDTAHDLHVVADALHRTGTTDLADRAVPSLSGGQRQRVMLARALAQEAPVLVLDEPSNHLDIGHQHELLGAVRDLGCTVVAALHDLNLALRYCDAVVVLAQGQVVAAGPPVDVLTPDLVSSTFEVDARILDGADEPVLAFRRRTRGPEPENSRPRPESLLR